MAVPVGGPPVPGPPPTPTQPHLVGTPSPAATPGSLWVEGSELHFINASGVEYAETGASVGTPSPTATAGSIWLEGDFIHYIDASNVERTASKTSMGASPGTEGSMWIESSAPTPAGQQAQYISGTTRYKWWNGF